MKSTLRSFAFLCFLGHYLHFTFFAVKKKTAGKGAKAGKLVAVRTRMGKSRPLERAQLANQIQGFRFPDSSDALESNKECYSYCKLTRLFVGMFFIKIFQSFNLSN